MLIELIANTSWYLCNIHYSKTMLHWQLFEDISSRKKHYRKFISSPTISWNTLVFGNRQHLKQNCIKNDWYYLHALPKLYLLRKATLVTATKWLLNTYTYTETFNLSNLSLFGDLSLFISIHLRHPGFFYNNVTSPSTVSCP